MDGAEDKEPTQPFRNVMMVDRLQAGWQAPDDILSRLFIDLQLLHEPDDAAHG